eukprot:2597717-Rhodomonas_salina.4
MESTQATWTHGGVRRQSSEHFAVLCPRRNGARQRGQACLPVKVMSLGQGVLRAGAVGAALGTTTCSGSPRCAAPESGPRCLVVACPDSWSENSSEPKTVQSECHLMTCDGPSDGAQARETSRNVRLSGPPFRSQPRGHAMRHNKPLATYGSADATTWGAVPWQNATVVEKVGYHHRES